MEVNSSFTIPTCERLPFRHPTMFSSFREVNNLYTSLVYQSLGCQLCSQNRIRTCNLSALLGNSTMSAFTVPPPDYKGHGFGFPICVHSFCSCVILREITRCPPKNPYFLSAQKFVKRPYCRLVYFNRPSSTFYIQEPIPSYGENESG